MEFTGARLPIPIKSLKIRTMKLYSKHHIVTSIIISSLITLTATAIICTKIFNAKNSKNQEKAIFSVQTESGTENSLKTNEASDIPSIPVTNPISKYTADEMQNINVYEKCNEAVVNINM